MRYLLILYLILNFCNFDVFSQSKFSAGTSGTYNFGLQTAGFGIRNEILVKSKFYISPQLKYTPPLKDFHELSLGINLHFYFLKPAVPWGSRYQSRNVLSPYLLGGAHFNRWINYAPSINSKAKRNNILPEIGAGIQLGRNNYRVFIEGKHNPLWMEPSGEIGIQYLMGSSSKSKCAYPQ